MMDIAAQNKIGITNATLFYYEAYHLQYDDERREWVGFDPEPSFTTVVRRPQQKKLEGFDIVTFEMGTCPAGSPLSCHSVGARVPVNRHCLLDTFDLAKQIIESSVLDDANADPGPDRIFTVYTVPK